MTGLYGDADMTKVMFGRNAVHVPAWMYVQHQGADIASFVGASRFADPHPLRYGSERTHLLVVGEIILRPQVAIATDALRGHGLGGLATNGHYLPELLSAGEVILGSDADVARLFGEG